MWAFDVISIIQIDSVMYGSPDRPVIDFIANASSKALDHGMSIATTALRDYHEKPDLIIIPGFANPHEIAIDRRTGDAKARLFTADPADALAIRDRLDRSARRRGMHHAPAVPRRFGRAVSQGAGAEGPSADAQREAAHLDARRRAASVSTCASRRTHEPSDHPLVTSTITSSTREYQP